MIGLYIAYAVPIYLRWRAGDSFVPLVTVGVEAEPRRITDVAPAVLEHFGVAIPESMEALAGVG